MTNHSDNNDSSTETSTNGKNPKKTLAKRGGTAGGKRVSTLSTPLSSNESYVNGHLSRVALASLAILTFITFVGNFTQLQLSAALPTIVSEFGISVTTGQWLTSIFQLVMGVMVPLTAFLTRRFTTRQIVIVSMTVFAVGSLLAWVGPTFLVVLAGRLLEAVGTGVMWPVLQITVFSIYPPWHGHGRGRHGHERGPRAGADFRRLPDRQFRLAFDFLHAHDDRCVLPAAGHLRAA